MDRPARIKTPFPSVEETAKTLGVSKRDTEVLSKMAERSVKTGEFVIPGVGRLVRTSRKPAKKSGKSRLLKKAKHALAGPKTK